MDCSISTTILYHTTISLPFLPTVLHLTPPPILLPCHTYIYLHVLFYFYHTYLPHTCIYTLPTHTPHFLLATDILSSSHLHVHTHVPCWVVQFYGSGLDTGCSDLFHGFLHYRFIRSHLFWVGCHATHLRTYLTATLLPHRLYHHYLISLADCRTTCYTKHTPHRIYTTPAFAYLHTCHRLPRLPTLHPLGSTVRGLRFVTGYHSSLVTLGSRTFTFTTCGPIPTTVPFITTVITVLPQIHGLRFLQFWVGLHSRSAVLDRWVHTLPPVHMGPPAHHCHISCMQCLVFIPFHLTPVSSS